VLDVECLCLCWMVSVCVFVGWRVFVFVLDGECLCLCFAG